MSDTTLLPKHLQEEYDEVVNNPRKLSYLKSTGQDLETFRGELLKEAQREETELRELRMWLELSDKEIVEKIMNLSDKERLKMGFLMAQKCQEAKALNVRITKLCCNGCINVS